jgi:hypothetical protein
MKSRIDIIIEKFNTRGLSMLSAMILIISGIYMCFHDLKATGKIDLKTTFVEGQIETGSLGLMAMFLGVFIILALNYRSQPFKGQEVELVVNGNQIKTKGLSYRKLKELISATTSDGVVQITHNKQINKD